MNIKDKLKIVERSVDSIATHDDEDSIVVLAALARVVQMAEAQAAAVRAKQQAKADAVIEG